MRRFLLHVLPRGYVRIRHFGILGNRYKKDKLEIIRKSLGEVKKLLEELEVSWKELMIKATGIDVDQCPKCSSGKLEKKNPFLCELNTT